MGLQERQYAVFSTYVEVILIIVFLFVSRVSILHVCGGDPIQAFIFANIIMYSPRMWR